MPVIRIENYLTVRRESFYEEGSAVSTTDEDEDVRWRHLVRAALSHASLQAGIAGIVERRHVTVVFVDRYEEAEIPYFGGGDYGGGNVNCNNPMMAVITVEGLFARSDRSTDDRRRLATALGLALRKQLPEDWEVEVVIRSYNAQSEDFVSIAADGTVCPA